MTSPSRRTLLATASVAVALAAADTYVVVLALTDMMAGVGLGIDALQRATPIISGFLLGYIAVLPLIGRISDLLPRQRVLLWCLAIFIGGSAVTALAHDLPTLVAGRVIQGVGGGGLVPATLAIVGELWPADRRGVPLGVVGAVQELGSVIGPVLGAIVLAVADWRMIFWLNAILGLLLAAAIAAFSRSSTKRVLADGAPPRHPSPGAPSTDHLRSDHVRTKHAPTGALAVRLITGVLLLAGSAITALALIAPESLVSSVAYGAPFVPFGDAEERLLTPVGVTGVALLVAGLIVMVWRSRRLLASADLPGALLLGGALGCVIITFAAARPETEVVGPLGFALLPVAALLAVGYVVHQRRAADPVVPRGTLTRQSAVALLVSLLVGVVLVAVVVDIPVFARLVHTDSEVEAALVLLRFLVAVPIGALVGGALVRFVGDGAVTAVGLALAAAGLLVAASWGQGALDGAGSYVVLLVLGFGLGLTLAPVNNVVLARTPPRLHGTASSLMVVARMIGMVVGLAALTGIGLHAYYREVAGLPAPLDPAALVDAALVQVHAVFLGAALAAIVGAVLAVALGVRRDLVAATEVSP